MEEIIFDSEEVLFTFEGNNYSAMVDFYGEETWKIIDVMIWNDTEQSWVSPFFPKDKKELTKFMNNEIDTHGNMNPPIGRTITMTSKQEKILETIIYFLERYKKAVTKSESSTGFEDMVFTEMIDTIKEVRAENKRLNDLNKPKILKGEDNE